MPGRSALAVIVAALVAVLVLSLAAPASAQETPSTGVPTPHIIPRPNSGHAPTDAGDRGGALQLVVLGLVVLAIGGAVAHLARQSRRARSSSS